MTVNTTLSRIILNGDGASLTFTIPFYFLQDSDLLVYVGGVPQLLTTDYTVVGAGEAGGGELSFVNPPAPGIRNVVIIRNPDLFQGTRYSPNDPFPARTHETALDKLTMLAQRTRDLIDRAFTLPDGDGSATSLTVPSPQAGYLIGWNPAGNGLANFAGTGGGGTLPLPVSLANGGTGASSAAAARANLGLASGATTSVGSAALLNAGTAPGNLVQLDAGARLPAVDASQLTNILKVPVRQTVLGGALDSGGYAAWLAIGSGLAVNALASAAPVTLAFARGYNAYGADDLVTRLAADQTNPFGNLPPYNTAFLYADYVSPTAVSGATTLVPPQYGQSLDLTKAALLRFEGSTGASSFVDDWGKAVVANGGVKLQSTQVKYGSNALGGSGTNSALNGTTDQVRIPSVTSFPNGGWALRGWFYLTSVAAIQTLMGSCNTANYGLVMQVSASARTNLYLSSTGGSWDIASGTVGTVAVAANTWTFIELTFDPVQGKYYLYVNGTLDQTISSTARLSGGTGLSFGGTWNGSAVTNASMQGYIDECELVPYCDHPNGIAYSPPASASSVNPAGKITCWFDIPSMKMWEVTGPNTNAAGGLPVLTQRIRLFCGEAATAAASVTSVASYAYAGRYDSGRFPVTASTAVTKAHNLGLEPMLAQAYVAVSGGSLIPAYYLYVGGYYGGALSQLSRLNASFYPSVNLSPPDPGGGVAGTAYNQARLVIQRGW